MRLRAIMIVVTLAAVGCTESLEPVGDLKGTGSGGATGVLAEGSGTDGGAGGANLATVPRVTGKRLAPAKSALRRDGLRVNVTKKPSSKPEGTVLSQSVPAGAEVHEGKTIKLVVAKPAPPPPDGDGNDVCTPGYSRCLRPAPDYDCAGGTGDGPKYTGYVMVTGSDPYGLDADGDGAGCE